MAKTTAVVEESNNFAKLVMVVQYSLAGPTAILLPSSKLFQTKSDSSSAGLWRLQRPLSCELVRREGSAVHYTGLMKLPFTVNSTSIKDKSFATTAPTYCPHYQLRHFQRRTCDLSLLFLAI